MRRVEIEKCNRVVTFFNKNEIERRIIKHDKDNFSKVNITDAQNNKMISVIADDETRDNILSGDSHRDKFNDDEKEKKD